MGDFVLGALAIFVMAAIFVPLIARRTQRAQHLADLELEAAKRDAEPEQAQEVRDAVERSRDRQKRSAQAAAMGLPGGMWGCSSCSAINDADARRCSRCGGAR